MAYTRVNWVDLPATTTPVDAANLNIMDAGIAAAYVQGTGGLLNVDIGAGAAIAKSKLASLDILNADVDAAAAIAISKLADPGSGKVITSAGSGAVAAFPPGYQLDYVPITAPVNVTATSTATANTIITGTSQAYDGTPIWVEFGADRIVVGTHQLIVSLYDGSTELGILCRSSLTNANDSVPGSGRIRLTPSAGTHQYVVKASVDAGTGIITAGAGTIGADCPAFIRVTKA